MGGAVKRLRTLVRERDRDDGRVLVLGIGLVMLLLVAIVGGIDTTTILLARMRMYDAADAAALDAADSIDEAGLYRTGVGSTLVLSNATVQQAAGASLAAQRTPAHVTRWAATGGTPDGRTAMVQVTGSIRPPITGGVFKIFGQSVTITVESHARARVG